MLVPKLKGGLCRLFVWGALTAVFAPAAILDTPVVPFNLGGTLNSTFQQFDPSLGTLTGVAVFYNNVLLSMGTHASVGPGGGLVFIFADFSHGAELTLPDVPQIAPLFQIQALHFGCQDGSKEFNSCSNDDSFNTGPLSGSMALSPSPDLSSYIGLGTVAFALTPFDDISNISANPGPAVIGTNLFVDGTSATGNLYLEYTYDAAAIATPEPASLGLSAGGLMLLVAGLYRRKYQRLKLERARSYLNR